MIKVNCTLKNCHYKTGNLKLIKLKKEIKIKFNFKASFSPSNIQLQINYQ